jgi:hypothetical protein
MVPSVCRLQVFNNLQAFLPVRRPSGGAVVGSHLHAPSGLVPGGVKVDYGEPWRGGVAAGLDCFSYYFSKVLSANCKGRLVIFSFRRTLSVKCAFTALAEMSSRSFRTSLLKKGCPTFSVSSPASISSSCSRSDYGIGGMGLPRC